MAGAKQYEVVGAAAVVPTAGGSERYLYRGAQFPASSSTEEGLKHLLAVGLIKEAGDAPASDDPYDGKTVPDLETLIKERNEGREDDKKIAPASSKKDDLLAALVADDESAKAAQQ